MPSIEPKTPRPSLREKINDKDAELNRIKAAIVRIMTRNQERKVSDVIDAVFTALGFDVEDVT